MRDVKFGVSLYFLNLYFVRHRRHFLFINNLHCVRHFSNILSLVLQCDKGKSTHEMHNLMFEDPTKLILLGPVCSGACEAVANAAGFWNITHVRPL